MGIPWAITQDKVEAVVRRIIEVGKPLKIILFGSYASGRSGRNSDLDVLVIAEDSITNPRDESVRIRCALRDISMPMDILVVPHSRWEQYKDEPGLIYREARRTGKVVYESGKGAESAGITGCVDRVRAQRPAASAARARGRGGPSRTGLLPCPTSGGESNQGTARLTADRFPAHSRH